MTFLNYCKTRYLSKSDLDRLRSLYNEKTGVNIDRFAPELLYVFHYILYNSPCYYWTEEVRKITYNQLKLQTKGVEFSINESILEHFYIAYDTYKQVTEIIRDFGNLNLDIPLKNRLYRLPTYITITEGCLTNLFKLLALMFEQLREKDYRSQTKLGQLCQVMEQNGFSKLIKNIDVDVRNAINHGGVVFQEGGKKILFKYMKKNTPHSKTYNYYEFDELLNNLYDNCSAVLLGVSEFINEHLLDNSKIIIKNNYLNFKILSMQLSIPSLECLDINDESINCEQLNITISTEKTDKYFIAQTAIEIAAQVYSAHSDYKKYYIQFENPRMLICFVRFTSAEIETYLEDFNTLNNQLLKVIERGDFQWSEPSDEIVDIREIKYFQFPSLNTDSFSVGHVENASTEDRKRLRADLFLGNATEKNVIVGFIDEAIKWISNLKNVPLLATKTKHGDMEADSVYLNVYRYDTRMDKSLLPQNDNFICFVDYNRDGVSSLKSGSVTQKIWNQFYHEKIGLIQVAWREQHMLSIKNEQWKIGRNEPCPCKSGLKYKYCCYKQKV